MLHYKLRQICKTLCKSIQKNPDPCKSNKWGSPQNVLSNADIFWQKIENSIQVSHKHDYTEFIDWQIDTKSHTLVYERVLLYKNFYELLPS